MSHDECYCASDSLANNFRTVCKLHMYVLLKYEPTVRKHKKSSLTLIFVNSEFESDTLSTSVLIHDSDAKTTALILGIPLLLNYVHEQLYIFIKSVKAVEISFQF